uniref:ATP synthase F0 subunit 6 n=1 Tax=Nippotaenia chaenogobii TaxID=137592 RepID=R4I2A4_9CEST|nr:ATP synthase F0 subunit 6 [Nippotaenia chaenogobii]
MYTLFNNYSSMVASIYNNIIGIFSYYYLILLISILTLFVFYRFPYCFSPLFFIIFLLCLVFTMFIALFTRRICNNYIEFLGSFIPIGTPLYICPLVCLAETISYIIRPFVLIFRPFINISLGCFGAVAISGFCFSNVTWMILLIIVFFYEVFVALVHWFIVTNILSFSVDH